MAATFETDMTAHVSELQGLTLYNPRDTVAFARQWVKKAIMIGLEHDKLVTVSEQSVDEFVACVNNSVSTLRELPLETLITNHPVMGRFLHQILHADEDTQPTPAPPLTPAPSPTPAEQQENTRSDDFVAIIACLTSFGGTLTSTAAPIVTLVTAKEAPHPAGPIILALAV